LPADAQFFVHSQPGRAIAISSDGTQIAYTTHDQMADSRIRVRRLDSTEIRSVPGTEFGRAPFFSRDGRWLAYFDWPERALKKVSLAGGQPVTLLRGLSNGGWILGSWCDDGRIVFDSWNGGLRVVNGDGTGLRALPLPADEWQLDAQPLPGGCRILYYTYRAEGYAIYVASVDGGTPIKILDNASHGRYLDSGHLLFTRDGVLHTAPFDPERLTVTGPVVPAPLEVAPDWYNVAAPTPQLGVSRNGTLVYAPVEGTAAGSTIVSVAHDGTAEDVGTAPFRFPVLALAPNGEDLVMSGRRAGRALVDTINLRDKATANLVDLGMVEIPTQAVWMPGGQAFLYSRYGPSEGEILRHELTGGGPDKVVARVPGTWICPWSVSPDSRWLVVARYDPKNQNDLVLVDLNATQGASSVKPLVVTAEEEGLAAISPNGQWFAYTSDKGDGREVFIDKFPEGGQRVRVGRTLTPPIWSPTGDAIYFTNVSRTLQVEMMTAQVTFSPRLSASAPRRLFSGLFTTSADTGGSVALTRDGKRFLMVKSPSGQPPSQGTGFARHLIVVQNWFTELKAGGAR
jgi:serine/threonine-protein kinase